MTLLFEIKENIALHKIYFGGSWWFFGEGTPKSATVGRYSRSGSLVQEYALYSNITS